MCRLYLQCILRLQSWTNPGEKVSFCRQTGTTLTRMYQSTARWGDGYSYHVDVTIELPAGTYNCRPVSRRYLQPLHSQKELTDGGFMQKGPLWPESLSYQKKDGCDPSFFWYDNDFSKKKIHSRCHTKRRMSPVAHQLSYHRFEFDLCHAKTSQMEPGTHPSFCKAQYSPKVVLLV